MEVPQLFSEVSGLEYCLLAACVYDNCRIVLENLMNTFCGQNKLQ